MALQSLRPEILIVETFHFGRRQMRFELLPLLEAARAMKPRPLMMSSIRDILQSNRKPGRAEETAALVERYFDLVMVHGDPGFASLEASFPLTREIAGKIAYTGLVAPPPPPAPSEQYDAVVSCGGGAAAGRLLAAAISAAERLKAKLGRWCLITGPNVESTIRSRPLPPHLELFEFRRDFPSLLAGARLSLSQAGYNTVCDILSAKCRAILVPFAGAGETEQPLRARRLAAMGLARVVKEEDLNSDTLNVAIEAALDLPPPDHGFDLSGAEGTVRLLRKHLAQNKNLNSAN
jgi:predicted glycosyltransferase